MEIKATIEPIYWRINNSVGKTEVGQTTSFNDNATYTEISESEYNEITDSLNETL